jgi:hypothetical protein
MDAPVQNSVIYSEERIPLRSAKTLIESASLPFSERERRYLQDAIDQESRSLVAAYRHGQNELLHDAVANRQQALARHEEAVADLTAAAADEQSMREAPGWLKVVICGICALACFAAEFALTWQALTFVLNVPKYSMLGILLGLAPPSALAALEIVILRLVEGPWRSYSAGASIWRRTVVVACMFVFLSGLAWGNIYTVLLLAEAREEAARAQYNLMREDGEQIIEVNQDAIDRAIQAVSVCVTVDGALFLLLALEEGRAARKRRLCTLRLKDARNRQAGSSADLARAESRLATIRTSLEALDATAEIFAERFRNQCLFELEQRIAKFRSETPIPQLVERGLRVRSV